MTAPTQPERQLTPAQLAALLALVEAQAAVRQRLTQTAVAAALAPFRAFTGWWNDAAVARLVTEVLRVVQPAQLQAARVTDAFLARSASLMLGKTVRPAGAVDITRLRRAIPRTIAERLAGGQLEPGRVLLGDTHNGPADTIDDHLALVIPDPGLHRARDKKAVAVDPGEPYRRIAEQYRYQTVAEGTPNERTRAFALVRLELLAETDVTLAVRAQYRKSMGTIPGVTGFRRILHPERSVGGPCGLCVVAASRVYRKEDLKPIHGRCVCEVLPIIGSMDPGSTLNDDDLALLYDAAGSTGGGKRQGGALKKVRVALAEHGELGPVLIDADQKFRGPAEVARTLVPDRATRARAELDALEVKYAQLLRRSLDGANVDGPLEWQSNRIDQLRRELASLS